MSNSATPSLRRGAPFEGSLPVANRKPVFINRKEIKDKLRADVHRPKFDVRDYYKDDGVCQKISRSEYFESVCMGVIVLNALWISLEADLNPAKSLLEAQTPFIAIENFFCAFFLAELLIRFFAFRQKASCFQDRWFVFDSIMVTLMVIETWILSLVFWAVRSIPNAGLSDASVVRVLRLMKLLRAARMARILRTMPEILIIARGMAAAVRSVMFTLVLLVTILYLFSLIVRQIADGTEVGETWFGTVPKTANQLVMKGMFFDDIGDIANDIANEGSKPLAVALWAAFFGFVILATLTVLNMLIGVLCDVVGAVGVAEREELAVSYIKEGIWPFVMPTQVRCSDSDACLAVERKRISKDQFIDLLNEPTVATVLSEAQVDVFSVFDLVDIIFADGKGMEKTLTFQELISVFMEFRLTKKATTKDISDFRAHLNLQLDLMDEAMQRKLQAMQAKVDELTPAIEKMAKVEPGYVEKSVSARLGFLQQTAKNMRIHHMMKAFDGATSSSPRSASAAQRSNELSAQAMAKLSKVCHMKEQQGHLASQLASQLKLLAVPPKQDLTGDSEGESLCSSVSLVDLREEERQPVAGNDAETRSTSVGGSLRQPELCASVAVAVADQCAKELDFSMSVAVVAPDQRAKEPELIASVATAVAGQHAKELELNASIQFVREPELDPDKALAMAGQHVKDDEATGSPADDAREPLQKCPQAMAQQPAQRLPHAATQGDDGMRPPCVGALSSQGESVVAAATTTRRTTRKTKRQGDRKKQSTHWRAADGCGGAASAQPSRLGDGDANPPGGAHVEGLLGGAASSAASDAGGRPPKASLVVAEGAFLSSTPQKWKADGPRVPAPQPLDGMRDAADRSRPATSALPVAETKRKVKVTKKSKSVTGSASAQLAPE